MKVVPDVAVQQLLNLLPVCRQLLHSHSLSTPHTSANCVLHEPVDSSLAMRCDFVSAVSMNIQQ